MFNVNAQQCVARSKRSGVQCRNVAVTSKRVCRMHGGNSRTGAASPNFKTGRRSRHLPKNLLAIYQQSLETQPENLLNLQDEISLTDTLVNISLEGFSEFPTKKELLPELLDLLHVRKKLTEAENRRLQFFSKAVPVETVLQMLNLIVLVIKRELSTQPELEKILMIRLNHTVRQFLGEPPEA